eukprot:scaffold15672_cov109-Isochrysis_galbana.AAC.2
MYSGERLARVPFLSERELHRGGPSAAQARPTRWRSRAAAGGWRPPEPRQGARRPATELDWRRRAEQRDSAPFGRTWAEPKQRWSRRRERSPVGVGAGRRSGDLGSGEPMSGQISAVRSIGHQGLGCAAAALTQNGSLTG